MTAIVASLLGQNITVAQVYGFVMLYVFPGVWGVISTALTWLLKTTGWLSALDEVSPLVKTWVTRALVALICLVLNLFWTVSMQQPVTLALALQTVVSYLSAVTAYGHTKPA